MKQLYLLAISLLLLSCQQTEKKNVKRTPEINPALLVGCEGIGEVRLNDTQESLEKKFGSSVSVHENTRIGFFTSVWENDPRQVNIYWKEKRPPFKTIKYIEAAGMGAPYMTKDSIMIGMTLREIVRKNGGLSVTFRNVSQDTDPGLITAFNNGDIKKNNPCFEGVLEQIRVNNIYKDELIAFQNLKEVQSYHPLMNRIEMELAAIRLYPK